MRNLLFILLLSHSLLHSADRSQGVRADLVSLQVDDINQKLTLIVLDEKVYGSYLPIVLDYSKQNLDTMRDNAVLISRALIEAGANKNRVLFEDRGFQIIAPQKPEKTKEETKRVPFSKLTFNPSFLRLAISKDNKTIYLFFTQPILRNGFQHYLVGYNTFESTEKAVEFGEATNKIISNSQSGLKISNLGSGINLREAEDQD